MRQTIPYRAIIMKLAFIAVASWTLPVSAVEFSGTGFLTIAAGKIIGGNVKGMNETGYNCPCQISDYSQAAVYEDGGVKFGPDSKLGFQGQATINDNLSFTAQVVSRGAQNGKGDLEWAYGSYALTPSTTLQFGRKRLPLFYYSETQDVGFSFPWLHLPPQTYGWEAVNYNGMNLLHKDHLGSWATTLNAFVGTELRKNDPYQYLYSGKHYRIDTEWSDIIGAEYLLSQDWIEGRVMYMKSNTRNKDVDSGNGWSPKKRQQLFGASLVLTPGDWLIMSEILLTNRKAYGGDFAGSFSVGHHFDKWLPMVTIAKYRQMVDADKSDPFLMEHHTNLSLVLRYDLTSSSDIKVQYDNWRDQSAPWFSSNYGYSRLITVSYDMVF
ncbi:conserved hypothetical protein [Gammaproteobacteria bacterium]